MNEKYNIHDASFLRMVLEADSSKDKITAYQRGYKDAIVNTLNIVIQDISTYNIDDVKKLIDSYKQTINSINQILN